MNQLQELYNCVIVDDDEIDRRTTISFVKKYPFLNVVASVSNALDAILFSRKNKIFR